MNGFISAVCVHKPVPGASISSMKNVKWVINGHISLLAASIAFKDDIICAKNRNEQLPGAPRASKNDMRARH